MSSVTMKPAVHPFQTDDPRLREVHEKVIAAQALEIEDVTSLYASKDILAIGWLANYARERKHGAATLCTVDTITHLPNTASLPVLAQVESLGSDPAEFLVVGSDFDRICRAVETLKKNRPGLKVSAGTVEELAVAQLDEMIRKLREVGVDSLVGSGAEIFLPSVRKTVWRNASTADRRTEARRLATAAGLAVPLYLVQRPATAQQQALELLSFRNQSAKDFAAISFDPDATTSVSLAATTGMQEMKQIAIARLTLDHAPHIRAYWEMLGGKLVQIALRFGASHLDGTALDAAVDQKQRARELAREVQVAGREPHEAPAMRRVVIHA
jgi:aminodeoxyfutalosine synthase